MAGVVYSAAAAALAGCAAVLAYAFAGYPILVAALARLRPRPFAPAPIEPRLSLVIAAYNEEGPSGSTHAAPFIVDFLKAYAPE